jgi:ATP phosphoribosyltransferase regulatory subunit
MALKPDVTLSIVKNSPEKEDGIRKVYYNENVYRVPKGSLFFKEIMQAGLECIGELDTYSVAEVLSLAAKSLALISPDYVLDVSHMGIIAALVDGMGLSTRGRAQILACIGEKNIHGIDTVCLSEGIDVQGAKTIKSLIAMRGDSAEMLEILKDNECYSDALELAQIIDALTAQGNRIRVDFSVTDDTNYYSGIVFKGFIKGIPTSVLSGGRYDNLMKKMGKHSGAIGFAVYLDLLGELDENTDEYDTDVLVIYDDKTDVKAICELTDRLTQEGKRVTVKKDKPQRLKYKELIDITGEGR